MVLDDEIQDKDVQNAPDAVEQAQWLQSIQRDFGSIEVDAFKKQLMLVKGTPSAKVYYCSLLKSFPTKIDNFIEFSKKYHDETGESNPSNEMLREAKPYFDKVHTTINGWKLLPLAQKFQKIREYQEAYRELIHFLAFQKVRYDYLHSALWYAIGYGAVDIAIDLINTPGIDLNFYHKDSLTTVLMHAAYHRNYTIVRALCEMPGVDLHIKDIDAWTALDHAHKQEIKILLMYHMLKTATPDAALRVLFTDNSYHFTKEDVYQQILSLVNETKDDNVKVNIFENAIAKVDGEPASALSYYLHVIKSPYNDVVKKIKDKIDEIKSNTKSKIEIVIEKPTITVEQINNRPEDKYIKPEVLSTANKKIESRSVSDLEFEEEMYAKDNGLIPEEEPTRDSINKLINELRKECGFIPLEEEPTKDSMTYIINKNDAGDSASNSQQQSQDQNRSIPIAVANAAPSNAGHIYKTKIFPAYYLRTSLIGSLVVGLILGLILGFGFDLPTASSAISAVVSAVSTFGLSLGSYYFAAKHMSSENDPLLFNVDKTNERKLTLMNKSHIIDNSTNNMQNTASQGVVAAPGAPGYAAGRICQKR